MMMRSRNPTSQSSPSPGDYVRMIGDRTNTVYEVVSVSRGGIMLRDVKTDDIVKCTLDEFAKKFRTVNPRRRRNPPPRLEFRPPDVFDLRNQCFDEVNQHITTPPEEFDTFSEEELEDFINYVDAAFKSVPPDVFRCQQALLQPGIEIPGIKEFDNEIECWWMKDPIALRVAVNYPGNSPIPFATVDVTSWQAFQAAVWQNGNEFAGASPYGAQIACIKIVNHPDNSWIVDELESTGEWRLVNGSLVTRRNAYRVVLFEGEHHPALVGNVRDKGLLSLNVDNFGRAYGTTTPMTGGAEPY